MTRASDEYSEPAAEDSGEDILPDLLPKQETGSEIAEIRPWPQCVFPLL